MEKRSYVYKITCKITGEYYFGSSFNAKRNSYWGGGKRIRERVAQYGKENFVKEILGEFDDRTIAHKVENDYIEQFRHDVKCLNRKCEHHFGTYGKESLAKMSAANRGENNPMYGKIFSEEHRAKLSAVHLGEKNHNFGKHLSEEVKAKLSAANRGKTLSEETRAKMSAARLGKHRTEETKQKIRESLRCRTPWNKGKKLNKETGKYE